MESYKKPKYKIFIYLILSLYLLIQTTFFPQKLAHLLMAMFEPTVDGRTMITSPYDIVRYYNLVVYGGLTVAGSFFLEALELVLHRFAKDRGLAANIIGLWLKLLNVVFVYLCLVRVFHLFRGEKTAFFSLSLESTVTLLVLLACMTIDYFRRHIQPQLQRKSD